MGSTWPEDLTGIDAETLAGIVEESLCADPARALAASRRLFVHYVEPLGDGFAQAGVHEYVNVFSRILQRAYPELINWDLPARFERIARVRPVAFEPRQVFVLSRVTLGADIAVTSVVLDAVKKRFPASKVILAGPKKNAELFRDVEWLEIPYPRSGHLRDRLAIWPLLQNALGASETLVLDPDSRLAQLGLLPAGDEDRYHFFDSRSYGTGTEQSLAELTAQWTRETLGVEDARSYIHTDLPARRFASTVSLGVGENPAKRIPDPFEAELLARLPQPILMDAGAGGEEAERAHRAATQSGANVELWNGSFAGFAEHIKNSGLYAGYDSAGGHAAAACGVPLLSIFRGAVCERMFHRWRPTGLGKIQVIRAEHESAAEVLREVDVALARLFPAKPAV